MAEIMKKIKKLITVKVEKTKDPRVLKFIGTDETVDRDNEIMTTSGWKINHYKKNPVILWAHNHRELPIAKTVKLQLSKEKGMVFFGKFPEKDIHPFADTVFKLYKEKYLNAFSVGFMILKDGYERQDGDKPNLITKKELFEVSAVPVPANPSALQTESLKSAVKDGVINEQEYLECKTQSEKFLEMFVKSNDEEDFMKEGDEIIFDNEEDEIKTEEPEAEEPEAVIPEPKKIEPISKNVYDEILSIKELKTDKKSEPLSTNLMANIKDAIPKEE